MVFVHCHGAAMRRSIWYFYRHGLLTLCAVSQPIESRLSAWKDNILCQAAVHLGGKGHEASLNWSDVKVQVARKEIFVRWQRCIVYFI